MSEVQEIKVNAAEFQETLQLINLPYTEGAEKDEEFLGQLIQGLDGLGENEWKEVTQELQKWFNTVAELMENSGEEDEISLPPLVVIDTSDVEVVDVDEVVGLKDTADEGIDTPNAAPKEKAPKEKKPKKAPEDKLGSARTRAHNLAKGVTAAERVREIVLANTDIKLDDVMKQLEEEGIEFKRSSAGVVYNGTLTTLKTLSRLGKACNAQGEITIEAK